MQSKAPDAPVFPHDCPACVFLGHVDKHDLYFCPRQVGGPTIIARYGVAGSYRSGLVFAAVDPLLGEAAARARARGLLPPEEGPS